MPDVFYSYHIPKFSDSPDEPFGDYGTLRIVTVAETVELVRYKGDTKDRIAEEMLDFDDWDEYLRKNHMVVSPLITRGGACVMLETEDGSAGGKTLGCLITQPDAGALFNPQTCSYQALISKELDTAELFFLDLLGPGTLVPIGEVMYLDISVLEEPGFRAQANGGRLLYTRLAPPNVRAPEEGKLYVTGLYQPLNRRGVGEVSASPITFAVNPWDVQLASSYTGDSHRIIKRLR